MTSLSVRNISKNFRKVEAVDDISLEIEDKEFFVILGPSGSGKTTLLRLIAGLEHATSGKIILDQEEITDFPPKDRNMAMVFQNYALYPFMTVEENLAFPLRTRKVPKEEARKKVAGVAEMLGIEELLGRKPSEISGGQRQRVALGRALVREPSIFLMDEPLSNLDAKLRSEMRVELRNLQKKVGITTIYVTHDQIEAMTLADRIAVLNKGKLVQVGKPMEIYNYPSDMFVAGFVGDPPTNFLKGTVSIVANTAYVETEDYKVQLPFPESLISKDGVKISIGIRPEDLAIGDEGISATVQVIQPVGRRKYVSFKTVKTQTNLLRATSQDDPIKEGQVVKVKLKWENATIFDDSSGSLLWSGKRNITETQHS